jgi:hypothetical protein
MFDKTTSEACAKHDLLFNKPDSTAVILFYATINLNA